MPLPEATASDFDDTIVPPSTVRPSPRVQAKWFDLGPNPLTVRLLVIQAVLLIVVVASYRQLGLSLAWDTFFPVLPLPVLLFAVWLYYFFTPGKPSEWKIPETIFIFLILILLARIITMGQYPAGAWNRPTIDALLAAADERLGVHVPTLVEWTRAHPRVNTALLYAYESFTLQLTLAVPVLGLALSDRRALMEYTFHFYFCAIVTLICFAVFPAACAFKYYGFASTFDQARFITQFEGLRSGALTVIRFDDLEGLVSMPSFHVAGGMFVTWAFRRHRLFFVPLLVLNTGLVVATFMSGTHYFVDGIGTLLMLAVSILLYRWWAEPLVDGRSREA